MPQVCPAKREPGFLLSLLRIGASILIHILDAEEKVWRLASKAGVHLKQLLSCPNVIRKL